MRRAARVDGPQSEIVECLRLCGCSVQSLAQLGAGVPDLLVAVAGTNLLVEVKDGKRPASERKLTPDQQRWHAAWRGRIHILESVQQALDLVDFMRGRLRRPGL